MKKNRKAVIWSEKFGKFRLIPLETWVDVGRDAYAAGKTMEHVLVGIVKTKAEGDDIATFLHHLRAAEKLFPTECSNPSRILENILKTRN